MMSHGRAIHQQGVRDWVQNGRLPGAMPAAIFEKGAEREALEANIGLCLAAGAVEKRRNYLMHRAVVGGVLVFKLCKDGLKGRAGARKASDYRKKTFFLQQQVPVVSLVHKGDQPRSFRPGGAFRQPVGQLFERGA